MKEDLLIRLLSGDQEAIESFGESDNCFVVDWRDGLPEILEAIAPFVPADYLRYEKRDANSYLVKGNSQKDVTITVSPNIKQEELLQLVSLALRPDFELRQYTPVDGDSYALFIAPSSLWRSIESAHPKATEKYFLSIDRLSAYWRKSYFARLFTKP